MFTIRAGKLGFFEWVLLKLPTVIFNFVNPFYIPFDFILIKLPYLDLITDFTYLFNSKYYSYNYLNSYIKNLIINNKL